MPPGHVLHAGARCLSLIHHKSAEASIVRTTPLPHDLDPLHRCCHCSCHTGSLILATHASQETQASCVREGGQGRTLTEDLPAAQLIDRLATSAAGFRRASSLPMLCQRAAIEFRRLTRFDRVMVYRFLDDDSGKVLAEDCREGMQPFLNHHFPASDIPPQARALYVRNVLRVIPCVFYEPLVLRPAWTSAAPLDMSDCSLRSVSPIHLEYLSNMGVEASASFSIIKDGHLWGLVACHHDTPQLITYDVRAACRALAGSLGGQIEAMEEADGLRQRLRLRSFEDDIIALLSREGTLDETLSHHLDEICRMMDADGVAVLRGSELVMSDGCPEGSRVRDLAAWVQTRPVEPLFATDHLSKTYPPGAVFAPSGSGVLALILSAETPWIVIWFRAEQIEVVSWAGNPHPTSGEAPGKPLTPRTSFEAWKQIVSGHARPWTPPEIAAALRLRLSLLEVLHNRRTLGLNRQLTKALMDKDVLLQQKEYLVGEVNHRVQNSLAIVSSFLGIQGRQSNDPRLHIALEEARRRISAVALVHRRLYRGDRIEVVDMARYIEELCAETFAFMGADWAKHVTLNLAPITMSNDHAVSLGLILTELLINANKYAYGGAPGPLDVSLVESRSHIVMSVSDHGVGRQSDRAGFGSRMLVGLVKQLKGELISTDNRPGLCVSVCVPIRMAVPLGSATS